MRVIVTLPPSLTDEQRVTLARGFLMGVTAVNRVLIREGLVPPLYKSGVRYAFERGDEEFADALTCFQRGLGDCDDLCPWRLAELLEHHDREVRAGKRSPASKPPGLRLYMRRRGDRAMIHVQVRHSPTKDFPNGRIEDPSRLLGMPS